MTKTISQKIPGEYIRIAFDGATEQFWQSAKEEKLVGCQCAECGHFRMPPTPFCPDCQSTNKNWPELSGEGEIYSFTICHKSPFPGAVEDFSYVPAIIELADAGGTRLAANVIDVAVEDVHIGMKVEILWGEVQDGWKIPIFRPKSN